MSATIQKVACPHCGEHIEFELSDAGRECECPHCLFPVTLSAASAPPPIATKPAPKRDEEEAFYQHAGIAVTRTRFIVPEAMFSIANMSSVQVFRTSPSPAGPITVVIAGLVLGAIASASLELTRFAWLPFVGIFLISAIIAAVWANSLKPTYTISFTAGGSDQTAFRHNDRFMVHEIVEAINRAIVARG